MKASIVILALLFTMPAVAKQKSSSTKLNTNLYEQEDSEHSVTGKVKVVREVQGDTEIFIDNSKGNGGPFLLPQNIRDRGNLLKILNKSQKTGGPTVTLSIDEQQRIKSVEENAASTKDLDWGL